MLEQSFVRAFNALCKDNEKIIDEFLDNLSKSLEYREHEKEIKKLNDKTNKLHNQRNQLVDLLLEQKINKDIYDQKYAKVSEEIEIAEGELQAYNENNEFGEDFRSRLLSFKRIFEKKKTMENFDGEIFRTLIKEAYIGETDEAGTPLPHTINFVFKTGLKINISPLFPKEPPPEADHARGVRSGTTEKGLMSDGSPRGDFYRKQLLFSFKKQSKQSAYSTGTAGNKVKCDAGYTMVNVWI